MQQTITTLSSMFPWEDLSSETQFMYLDPAIRDWVLIPIMVIMILVGVLRHDLTLLFMGEPKPALLKAVREMNALKRAVLLRQHASHIPYPSFQARRNYFCQAFEQGDYLKNPSDKETGPANPMTDPSGMEAMMDGMKKNMMMFIPQSIIMGWITFFFSGFVLVKLPFPLTLRFKGMLQRGIETADMDVSWVSSLSWYFLNLFGLRGVFSILLGEDNVADSMKDVQAMSTMGMQAQPGQTQDWHKLFLSEKENLELAQHSWELNGVEDRVLAKYKKKGRNS